MTDRVTAHEVEFQSRTLNRKTSLRNDAQVIAREVEVESRKGNLKTTLRRNGRVTTFEVKRVSRKLNMKRVSRDNSGQATDREAELESGNLMLKGTLCNNDQIGEKTHVKRRKGLQNSVFPAFCRCNKVAVLLRTSFEPIFQWTFLKEI